MVKIWLNLEVPEAVVEDIARIQDPVQQLSWVNLQINYGNLRDLRTEGAGDKRPGVRIKPKEIE